MYGTWPAQRPLLVKVVLFAHAENIIVIIHGQRIRTTLADGREKE